ncbi:APC family permease [Candidatus Cetobacterium colombiensis]|uniref:APC family permease n=1 Tax=Candidatus Cetobacterium colombiensis TaxID=3073100 RepID=A0ABU4W914_9FUSO|nr:APC family permease [Candidatus Cetobacterium colombiensis]MDX8336012.1 APC family permease [Candidatus Cetobacterium colombiensis]
MSELSGNKLGFWSIFFLGINSIIGSGIFLLPNKAYADVGLASIVVILINAVLALFLALCFAETASIFDKNGSSFVYAKEAYGNFVGFEIGIFAWFIGIVSWAAELQGFLTALGGIYPLAVDPYYNKIFVIAIGAFLGVLNYLGVKFSKILNNVITVSKLLPLILFIFIGIFFIKGPDFFPLVPKIQTGLATGNLGVATLVIFYAFTGFDLLAVAAEDMENPTKNLPKAIIWVMVFCSVFYLLIMIVCIGLLGPKLGTTSVPIATATAAIFGNTGFLFITIATLVSIGGITIALSFIAPRSIQALADSHYVPVIFNKKGRFGTAGFAILITTLITISLALYGNFIFLASLTVIARLIEFISTAGSVLVFRKRKLKALYKIPLGPIIPVVAIVLSIWLLAQSSYEKLIFVIIGLVIGGILYVFYAKKQMEKN